MAAVATRHCACRGFSSFNCEGGMFVSPVGYTMRDIRYKWNEGPNSVGVSSEVSLPQFKVLGHRQKAMEISLTTGTVFPTPAYAQVRDILIEFAKKNRDLTSSSQIFRQMTSSLIVLGLLFDVKTLAFVCTCLLTIWVISRIY